MNDSTRPGYLRPANLVADPLEGITLFGVFQALVAGLTGIDGTLVRPRWQAVPANRPDITTDWVAVGVTTQRSLGYAYETHVPDTGLGNDLVAREEQLDVLCSCYGPNAGRTAALIRDGLNLGQNRDELSTQGVGVVHIDDAKIVPDLVNAQWYFRVDLPLVATRAVVRVYPVRTIASFTGQVSDGDNSVTTP